MAGWRGRAHQGEGAVVGWACRQFGDEMGQPYRAKLTFGRHGTLRGLLRVGPWKGGHWVTPTDHLDGPWRECTMSAFGPMFVAEADYQRALARYKREEGDAGE